MPSAKQFEARKPLEAARSCSQELEDLHFSSFQERSQTPNYLSIFSRYSGTVLAALVAIHAEKSQAAVGQFTLSWFSSNAESYEFFIGKVTPGTPTVLNTNSGAIDVVNNNASSITPIGSLIVPGTTNGLPVTNATFDVAGIAQGYYIGIYGIGCSGPNGTGKASYNSDIPVYMLNATNWAIFDETNASNIAALGTNKINVVGFNMPAAGSSPNSGNYAPPLEMQIIHFSPNQIRLLLSGETPASGATYTIQKSPSPDGTYTNFCVKIVTGSTDAELFSMEITDTPTPLEGSAFYRATQQ